MVYKFWYYEGTEDYKTAIIRTEESLDITWHIIWRHRFISQHKVDLNAVLISLVPLNPCIKKKHFVKENKDQSLTLEMVSNEQPCDTEQGSPCNGEQ